MQPETRSENALLLEEINQLRKEKNAIILAHYYQVPEIQELADFVGDSLALAQRAAKTNADVIVFAGVHFMAETAKILNPWKKVLLPDLAAGCSLADSCPPDAFRSFLDKHPNHAVVSYVNCSAEIKTMSDIICTSSNARKVIDSIPEDVPIIFAPDANLGKYLTKVTGREMLLWDGACIVHEAFDLRKILHLKDIHPEAKIIAHPESESHILKLADFIGSTSALLQFAADDDAQSFIVATEYGILHEMQKRVPHKTFIPAPIAENNTCACSECPYMKMNTLEKLRDCLLHEQPEILLDDDIREKALKPLLKMLEISKTPNVHPN